MINGSKPPNPITTLTIKRITEMYMPICEFILASIYNWENVLSMLEFERKKCLQFLTLNYELESILCIRYKDGQKTVPTVKNAYTENRQKKFIHTEYLSAIHELSMGNPERLESLFYAQMYRANELNLRIFCRYLWTFKESINKDDFNLLWYDFVRLLLEVGYTSNQAKNLKAKIISNKINIDGVTSLVFRKANKLKYKINLPNFIKLHFVFDNLRKSILAQDLNKIDSYYAIILNVARKVGAFGKTLYILQHNDLKDLKPLGLLFHILLYQSTKARYNIILPQNNQIQHEALFELFFHNYQFLKALSEQYERFTNKQIHDCLSKQTAMTLHYDSNNPDSHLKTNTENVSCRSDQQKAKSLFCCW